MPVWRSQRPWGQCYAVSGPFAASLTEVLFSGAIGGARRVWARLLHFWRKAFLWFAEPEHAGCGWARSPLQFAGDDVFALERRCARGNLGHSYRQGGSGGCVEPVTSSAARPSARFHPTGSVTLDSRCSCVDYCRDCPWESRWCACLKGAQCWSAGGLRPCLES